MNRETENPRPNIVGTFWKWFPSSGTSRRVVREPQVFVPAVGGHSTRDERLSTLPFFYPDRVVHTQSRGTPNFVPTPQTPNTYFRFVHETPRLYRKEEDLLRPYLVLL